MDNDKVYYSFKTLADVKRAMKVGLKFRCEHYRVPERTGARTVAKVQTNGIWFVEEATGLKGWAIWPERKRLRIERNTVTFEDVNGEAAFCWVFPQSDPPWDGVTEQDNVGRLP